VVIVAGFCPGCLSFLESGRVVVINSTGVFGEVTVEVSRHSGQVDGEDRLARRVVIGTFQFEEFSLHWLVASSASAMAALDTMSHPAICDGSRIFLVATKHG
jgi:hypothetical protein